MIFLLSYLCLCRPMWSSAPTDICVIIVRVCAYGRPCHTDRSGGIYILDPSASLRMTVIVPSVGWFVGEDIILPFVWHVPFGREADPPTIINRRLHITKTKFCISPMQSIVYHQGTALHKPFPYGVSYISLVILRLSRNLVPRHISRLKRDYWFLRIYVI